MKSGALTSRGLLISMLVLFGICLLQATYWVYDQVSYAKSVKAEMVTLLQEEAQWANETLETAVLGPWVERHPHLTRAGSDIVIDAKVLRDLTQEMQSRINRYRWEGGFFLLVLLLGTAVLARTLRQHDQLLRRQRNFLASVGHELRSPLASIKLSAETLELRELSGERVKTLSGRMLSDVARLETFIDNILEASRLETGNRNVDQASVDLEALVQEVVLQARSGYPDSVIEVQTTGRCVVNADPLGARAVIQNLVDNACKSIQAAGDGRVSVDLLARNSMVELTVSDGGLGFDPKEGDRIFQRFYRVGDELTRKTKGSGLGLYIAKSAMESDGGTLEASSDGVGCGATFRAQWPMSATKGAPA